MAIFSLSHSTVGKTTHAAGTAGAHARYVCREGAARVILGEHMPTDREAARAWLDTQEVADRKNARVIDKVMLALPVELDAAKRVELVHDFAAEIGQGRIAWLAGIHDRGEDAHNPHAHVIFRDRDIDTDKRVAELSGKGSTERLRETWERLANQALERAGIDARIDRRSLEAQGIERQAGIHIGANVLAMEERGIRPDSQAREVDGRIVDWPSIDQGRTRIDRLAEIEAANDNREQDKERGKGGKGRSDPTPVHSEPSILTLYPELEQVQEAQKQPVERPNKNSPRMVAEETPEATPRTSYADVSRLRLAIDRARERLEALGNRLEAAFDRFRHMIDRHQPETKKRPEHQHDPLYRASIWDDEIRQAERKVAADRLRANLARQRDRSQEYER